MISHLILETFVEIRQIWSSALIEVEIPRPSEARSNHVGLQRIAGNAIIEMPEHFAPKKRKAMKFRFL